MSGLGAALFCMTGVKTDAVDAIGRSACHIGGVAGILCVHLPSPSCLHRWPYSLTASLIWVSC
jgi:hypothetical protein